MKRIYKNFILLVLNLVLIVSMGNLNPIEAIESDYSISSPETMTYTSGVKSGIRRQLFNDNWKFIYGEQSNAQNNAYDDSKWSDVQLPHDYSLDLAYDKKGEAESGYKLGGIGWYRKSFSLDAKDHQKRVVIEFGGIYMNATVFINGHELGDHPNGFTPFAYDISDYIDYEGENIIAVRVDHKFPSSRWYSGSGIYRNVHLTLTNTTYVDHYGVKVMSPNLESQMGSLVSVDTQTRIANDSDESQLIVLRQSIKTKNSETRLVEVDSETVEVEGQSKIDVEMTLNIDNPTLWSLENPYLYEVVSEVLIDGKLTDTYVSDYGFRTIAFDAETGFYLNQKAVKLQGVSMHSDQGSLGAAAHYRAMERQVEILQEMGVNAIRVTHNPAADELIEIANRKGMLIIDESFDTWVASKNGNVHDYAGWFKKTIGDNPLLGAEKDMTWAEFDIKTMVHRGINAPSIISWSVGNEVMEGNSGPYSDYPNILRNLATWVTEVDQSRPATIGDNKLKANWKEAVEFGKILTELNGTVGFNYAGDQNYDSYHKQYPEWKMYGAETSSAINSRGVYKPSNYDRHLTSYDDSAVGWGRVSADSWHSVITRDFLAGEFVWTGFDYLGEPTPYNNVGPGATGAWPSPKSSYFGIVDTAGLPKDRFYFYQTQWNKDVDTLHVLPTWKKDTVQLNNKGEVRVDVYSNAASVELFYKDLAGNETSLGKKEFTSYTTPAGHTYQIYEGKDKHSQAFRNMYLTWNVPYADGTVYAVSYNDNGEIIENTQGRHSVTTFQEAHSLNLSVDRSEIMGNGRDLSYVTIDVLDKEGNLVEDAMNLIDVTVEGNGKLIALDNGDQVDHEPYNSGRRKAFNGKLVAIVKAEKNAGEITLNVSSKGLNGASTTITTLQDHETSNQGSVVAYTMSKNYYVKLGHQPELQKTVQLNLNDGSKETLAIDWQLDDHNFDSTGTFSVQGYVNKYDLKVQTNVSVIESVGALLNYAAVTPKGVASVNLPSSRPLVLENGTILDIEFPVEWETQKSSDYDTEGTVILKGRANVFGEVYPVSASIRVSDVDVTLGANVAGNNLTLIQNIPHELQSDSLASIVDGNTGFKTVQSGPNNSVWTNYDMAQTGINTAEIVFTFATAQYLGEANLYFYQDAWASRLPENVELYWSNEGTENAVWSKLDVVETIGSTSPGTPNTTPYNYKFNGVSAVGFKIVLTGQNGTNASGKAKLAMGLSEVQLHVVETTLQVNQNALLESLNLNGVAVSSNELSNKLINTEYQKVVVEPKASDNAAVTVLKPFEKVVRILTESEDHQNREVYTINLDQQVSDGPLGADDATLDYDYTKMKATAGAAHQNHASEGDPKYAIDNDEGTIFHTPWGGTDKENFWLTLELEDISNIDALRYQSRGGNNNGIVKDYRVEVSLDNETWIDVASGTWSSDTSTWSIAQFDESVEAKFIRLTALTTYGDGAQANRFMTAKEIRVRETVQKTSLEGAEIELDITSFEFDGTAKEPVVTLTLPSNNLARQDGSLLLEEGVDYRVSYENNTEVGTARIVVNGIVKYSGEVETTFEIVAPKVDKTALETLVLEIQQMDELLYTPSTWVDVKDAYQKAQGVLLHQEASVEDVAVALDNLQIAHSNLALRADKTSLKELIVLAQSVDKSDKTLGSLSILNKALNDALKIIDDLDVLQSDADASYDALRLALDNLERIDGVTPVDPEEGSGTDNPDGNEGTGSPETEGSDSKAGGNLPSTGVENHALGMGLFISLIGFVVYKLSLRRKEH